MSQPSLDRLQSILLNSGLQISNNALYQVIKQLIDFLRQIQIDTNAATSSSSGALNKGTFLTVNSELATLPFSRQLVAGTNVTFDDTVFGVRTVNVSSSSSHYDAPLTDGNVDETDLIFANGECVIVQVPI